MPPATSPGSRPRLLGHSIRVEHEDQANSHGRAVGANMAGADTPYTHLPFFYSDLFELGYEAVGEVDSRRETAAEWAEPFRKGVVAYLDEARRPRGFLFVDVWGKTDAGDRADRGRRAARGEGPRVADVNPSRGVARNVDSGSMKGLATAFAVASRLSLSRRSRRARRALRP